MGNAREFGSIVWSTSLAALLVVGCGSDKKHAAAVNGDAGPDAGSQNGSSDATGGKGGGTGTGTGTGNGTGTSTGDGGTANMGGSGGSSSMMTMMDGGMNTGSMGPQGTPCASSGECSAPTPYCHDTANVCVECLGDANCGGGGGGGGGNPACDTASGTCVECTSDDHCDGMTPHCDTTAHECVACIADADCGDPTLACNPANHRCVETCKDSGDCAVPTPYCSSSTSFCVQCLDNPNCADPDRSVCSAAGSCVECVDDSTCTDGRPYCVVADSRCVECVTDENCGGAGMVCQDGRCEQGPVACADGAIDCNGNGRCIDTDRDPDHCGSCDNQCNNSEACSGGQCGCRAGLTDCGGNCVDTDSSPNNCGGCNGNGGDMCQSGEICNAGSCMTGDEGDCPNDACSNNGRVACVDFDTDPLNCGDCGQRCDRDEVCIGGDCRGWAPAVGCNQCPCDAICEQLVDAPTCCDGAGGTICVEADNCP